MNENLSRRSSKPPLVEWILGGISAALVLTMIGFILYRAISATATEPDLSAIALQVERVDGGFRIPFRAINKSDATAANVKVEGRLRAGDSIVETSDVTLDYVPAHSERKAGLFFRQNPAGGKLQLNVNGYTAP